MEREMYDDLYKEISKVFDKVTPSGRISKVRSRNIYFFLLRTIGDGIEKSKKLERRNNFKKYMNELKECGITEQFIRHTIRQ
jgi:II/X family phage/plasmid replication protein